MVKPANGIANVDSWVARRIGCESLDARSIRNYQLARIRETLDRAMERSPFYREHLSGARPASILSAEDYAAVRPITEDHLRKHGIKMLCVSQGEIHRVVSLDTSGTTGQPKRIFLTAADQGLTVEYFMEGMASFSEPGDRILILLPGIRPGGIGAQLHLALERIGARPFSHGPIRNVGETMAMLKTERMDCVIGTPNQLLFLARVRELYGLGPARLPRALISTDFVPDSLIAELKRIWGCDATRYYGMTELGFGGGVECGYHDGFHLYEGDIYVEIIDPDTGALVPDGTWGEVVATTLNREGMPIIRYRTGDLSRVIVEPCPCGSPLRRLENIPARLNGMIPTKNGAELRLSDLDECLFDAPGIVDFGAVLTRGNEYDLLTVNLDVLKEGTSESVYRERVEKAPALRSAFASDALRLQTAIYPRGLDYLPSYAKRKITILPQQEQ